MCIWKAFGKHSRSIHGMYRKRSGSMRLVLGTFGMEVLGSVCFPNTPNGSRTWRMLSECFQYPFWNHTENIRKTNGKQSVINWGKHIRRDIRAVLKITPLLYSENKRKLIRASVITPGYVKRSEIIRMVDENYFEHGQHILWSTECRSVCIHTEPNSQYS